MFDSQTEERQAVEAIPSGLDQMEPGPVLAGFLAALDATPLSGYDRVVVLRAHQRMASHYQAKVYADMAAVVDTVAAEIDDAELTHHAAAAEIRAALRLTRRAADAALGFAIDLNQRLPGVWSALARGLIDLPRARVIAQGTAHLPEGTAREVVDQTIEDAPGLTTGQLRARLRRLCIDADPAEAERRYADTLADRRVVSEATPEGTAHLFGLDLAPHHVAAVTRHINQMARSLRAADEPRTMDQLRADVFVDLLLGRTRPEPGGRGVVDVRVDLETLAELSEAPGELAGYGPVIADIARQVSETQQNAEWRFTVTHPDTGRPVGTGITRRRPTAAQRRRVEARDTTCIFPGCRMPATGCDLDHRIPWSEGGRTTVTELAPGCRYDHVVVKHGCGWTYLRLPNGDYLWISRLGHAYTTSGRSP